MTETMRARCKTQTCEARRWDPACHLGRRPKKEDYTILNLENESLNDHTNALIVQDGCSCWIRSYLSKKVRMRQKEQSCLHEVHGSILKTWEYIYIYTDNFEGVHPNVSRAVNGLTTRRLLIAQKPMVSQRELSDE